MDNPTSPEQTVEQPEEAATPKPAPAPDAATYTATAWAIGNGPRQVALAGVLADDPTLRDAQLTAEEWQQRLDAYLASPRP